MSNWSGRLGLVQPSGVWGLYGHHEDTIGFRAGGGAAGGALASARFGGPTEADRRRPARGLGPRLGGVGGFDVDRGPPGGFAPLADSGLAVAWFGALLLGGVAVSGDGVFLAQEGSGGREELEALDAGLSEGGPGRGVGGLEAVALGEGEGGPLPALGSRALAVSAFREEEEVALGGAEGRDPVVGGHESRLVAVLDAAAEDAADSVVDFGEAVDEDVIREGEERRPGVSRLGGAGAPGRDLRRPEFVQQLADADGAPRLDEALGRPPELQGRTASGAEACFLQIVDLISPPLEFSCSLATSQNK